MQSWGRGTAVSVQHGNALSDQTTRLSVANADAPLYIMFSTSDSRLITSSTGRRRSVGASDRLCASHRGGFHGVGIRPSKEIVNACSACFRPELRIPVLVRQRHFVMGRVRWRVCAGSGGGLGLGGGGASWTSAGCR